MIKARIKERGHACGGRGGVVGAMVGPLPDVDAAGTGVAMDLFCAFYHLEVAPALAEALGAVSLFPYTDPWWWLLCG